MRQAFQSDNLLCSPHPLTSGSWGGEKVFLRDQVLEVRNVEGRILVARKPRRHDEWDPPIYLVLCRPRSSSASRVTAGAFGFLTLTQWADLHLRLPSFLGACLNSPRMGCFALLADQFALLFVLSPVDLAFGAGICCGVSGSVAVPPCVQSSKPATIGRSAPETATLTAAPTFAAKMKPWSASA